MQLSEDIVLNIHKEYLKLVVGYLRTGKIDRDIARNSASFFLQLLPFSSEDDMKEKIHKLTIMFPQFYELRLYMIRSVEEKKTNDLLERMRKHMSENNINEAINLASP